MVEVWYGWPALVVYTLSFITSYETLHFEGDPVKHLEWLSWEYWNWKLKEFPQLATYRGVHKYNDRLDEYTLVAFKRRKDKCQEFLTILHTIDINQLPTLQQENYEILNVELQQYVDGYKFVNFGNLNPLNFLEGIHRSHGWVSRMPCATRIDYDNLEARLKGISKQINDVIALMQEAIRLRRTNHMVSVKGVPRQVRKVVRPGNFSVYFWPYRNGCIKNSSLTPTERDNYQRTALSVINNEINPTYLKLARFMETHYLNNTRAGYGVGSLEFGQEYYKACLKFHLSADVSVTDVHEIGLREVERISKTMKKIMSRYGFYGRISEFVEFLNKNRTTEFYNRSKHELLHMYETIVYEKINPKLGMVVRNVPDIPIHIRPMPHDGPAGSYGANTFWVNVEQSFTRPTYTMMALTLHEANPGHHLQTIVASMQPLPAFRKFNSASRYYSTPFNFPWYSAYTEGWALYCEFLGEEMNLYNSSSLEMFGRYSSEIFRAVRLVVDTGIHAFGKSREWAIEFLANYTAQPRGQIESEVDRYITWPAQSCAYKIGELEIRRMRDKAQLQMGDKFDVRDFNEALLHLGRSPLTVVEKVVDKYIESTLSKSNPINSSNKLVYSNLVLVICAFSLATRCL